MKNTLFIIWLLQSIWILPTKAQVQADSSSVRTPKPVPDKTELKYNLNESGSHYFKVTFLNQTWLRFDQSNPGTTVLGEPAAHTFDVGLRRTRIQLYGQLTDRAFIYFQFGQNNFNFLSQNAGNRKMQVFFHDALTEYAVVKGKNYLKLGGGLTIANGLSRFSQPSIGTILTMDVPVFAQATVDQTDEFSRKLSVYARGQIGKIDYRLVVSDPFPITTNGQTAPALSTNSTFSQKSHHKQYQGFFTYQLWDKEPHTTPYMTGTYLGSKRVLNLEGGFITQAKAMWHSSETQDTVYTNLNLWSVAAFLDMPVNKNKGTAISAYAGYFTYDFGQGYLRYNGIMNPANGTTSPLSGISNTYGNAFPMFGTGNVLYSQVGYLLPKNLLGEGNGTLLPYASLMYANYKRLADPMAVYNLGINWLLKGHTSKLTLDYQNRPVYEAAPAGNIIQTTRRGCVVLQYQLFI
ncbi:hypothetical protein Q0590_07160 [Rhodocytophaga aerolata]|uniref:Porin n=2 Tax=Rhodocytophaga aerolata TaxID=455078 RepID=A0ABT8R1Q3_9BACT|nr:hypothetical protein [Rhodocytophaga aerolata]MDO1446024.1 hypothetical protein [Rhodocytophaga aerolata]